MLRLCTKLCNEFISSRPSKHKVLRKKPSCTLKNRQTREEEILTLTPEDADHQHTNKQNFNKNVISESDDHDRNGTG